MSNVLLGVLVVSMGVVVLGPGGEVLAADAQQVGGHAESVGEQAQARTEPECVVLELTGLAEPLELAAYPASEESLPGPEGPPPRTVVWRVLGIARLPGVLDAPELQAAAVYYWGDGAMYGVLHDAIVNFALEDTGPGQFRPGVPSLSRKTLPKDRTYVAVALFQYGSYAYVAFADETGVVSMRSAGAIHVKDLRPGLMECCLDPTHEQSPLSMGCSAIVGCGSAGLSCSATGAGATCSCGTDEQSGTLWAECEDTDEIMRCEYRASEGGACTTKAKTTQEEGLEIGPLEERS